jgi:hypothetical protein
MRLADPSRYEDARFFLCCVDFLNNIGVAVTAGTGYGLDDRGFGALFSVRDKKFTFLSISFCAVLSVILLLSL